MARANLRVNDALAAAFVAAQNSGGLRSITLRINVEGEGLEFIASLPASADAEADFAALATGLSGDVMGLFCVDPHSASPSKHWMVVSYLPPGTKPLLKMISASSRADVRDQLGTNSFVGEFHASTPDELTYAGLVESQKRDSAEALSEMEKRVGSERLESGLHRGLKMSAMGVVPFEASEALQHALSGFGAASLHCVEVVVVSGSETLEVTCTGNSFDGEGFAGRTLDGAPRFIVVRKPDDGEVALVTYTPESAKPGDKMLYATAKASLVERLTAVGAKPTSSLQCSTIPEVMSEIVGDAATAAGAGGASKSGLGGEFSKPSRPGRGRARMIRGGAV